MGGNGTGAVYDMYLFRYPLSHLANLLWLSPSSLSNMLSSKGILMKDEFVWWAAEQDNNVTPTKSEFCYHEQMGFKVNGMKWEFDKLLLGAE